MEGNNALQICSAASDGNITKIKSLIEQNIDPESLNDMRRTPLHCACEKGHLEVVQYLIEQKRCNLFCTDINGDSPLHLAAYSGNAELVKYLITKHNCDPGSEGKYGRRPSFHACEKGHLNIIQYLESINGVDFLWTDNFNNSILHIAAFGGSLVLVKYLVEEKSCDVNSQGLWHRTPLQFACLTGHFDIVKYLVECGCDLSHKDENGDTALHLANFTGNDNFYFADYVLGKDKCNIKCQGLFGRIPLLVACKKGNCEIVKYLIQQDECGLDVKDISGDTVLHLAALGGSLDVLEYLIKEKKCDPQCRNYDNRIPLHHACEGGNLEIAKYLIEQHGCNPNDKDIYEISPLDLAVTFNHKNLIDYFSTVMKENFTPALPPNCIAIWLDKNHRQWVPMEKKSRILATWSHQAIRDDLGPMIPQWNIYQKSTGDIVFINNTTCEYRSDDPRLSNTEPNEEELISVYFNRVVLFGPPGAGKTCLNILLLNDQINSSPDPIPKFVTFSQILSTSTRNVKYWKKDGGTQLKDALQLIKGVRPVSVYEEQSTLHISYKPLKRQITYCEADISLTNNSTATLNWLQFIDTGGQAQYLHLLSAFVSSYDLGVFVYKLSERLSDHLSVESKSNDERLETSIIKCTDILRRCALHNPKHEVDGQFRTLIAGLNTDPSSACLDGAGDEDEQLLKQLNHNTLNNFYFTSSSEGRIIFPLNIPQLNEKDKKVLTEIREKIIEVRNELQPKCIPHRWLHFLQNINIHSKNSGLGIVDLDVCKKTANTLNIKMEDMQNLLHFFHGRNVILYYPAVLPNVVFTNPQVLLNIITLLVNATVSSGTSSMVEHARNTGFISPQLLKVIDTTYSQSSIYKHGLFEPNDVITILLHLKVISKCDIFRDTEYFMPAILNKLDTDGIESELSLSPDSAAPLLVFYEHRQIRYGEFCFLITSLISSNNWQIASNQKLMPACVYSNCIKMFVSNCTVTLVDKVTYIEIHINSPNAYGIRHVCAEIKGNILETFCDEKPQFGFVCPCPTPGVASHQALLNESYESVTCSEDEGKVFSLAEIGHNSMVWLSMTDKQRCFTIINGKADVFELDKYGLTISVSKNCLPPDVKECNIVVTADLTTNIALPSGTSLVSGVYHIKTMPFIDTFIQPVELSIVHCANDSSRLCFVVAREEAPSKFEYLEGGTFEVDAKTGQKVGRIHVSGFSFYSIVWRAAWNWITGNNNEPNIEYCGSVYYSDNIKPKCRYVHFVIIKNLPLAIQLIKDEISSREEYHFSFEFNESQISLDLPKKSVGSGWEFVPCATPTEITKKAVDGYDRGKKPPVCSFKVVWKSTDQFKYHNERIELFGAKKSYSITVECFFRFTDSPAAKKPRLEEDSPAAKKPRLEEDSPAAKKPRLEEDSPSAKKPKCRLEEGKPTIKLLTCLSSFFDGVRKNLDIIQMTSTSYAKLGMHLLDDDNCDIVQGLEEKCHHDPVKTVTAVYKMWISGTGKKPVTWQTLVGVLKEIEMNSLADEIEVSLSS